MPLDTPGAQPLNDEADKMQQLLARKRAMQQQQPATEMGQYQPSAGVTVPRVGLPPQPPMPLGPQGASPPPMPGGPPPMGGMPPGQPPGGMPSMPPQPPQMGPPGPPRGAQGSPPPPQMAGPAGPPPPAPNMPGAGLGFDRLGFGQAGVGQMVPGFGSLNPDLAAGRRPGQLAPAPPNLPGRPGPGPRGGR